MGEEIETHLPVPVAWLGVAGRGRNRALQRRAGLIGVGDSGEAGPVQQLQRHQLAPVSHHEHAGVVGGARAALEREGAEDGDRRRARDGDGGQRPARPSCGFPRGRGDVLSV